MSKIPIHKHTPVRYKMSTWKINIPNFIDDYIRTGENLRLVVDVRRLPKSDWSNTIFTGSGLYESADGKYWVQPKNPYKSDLFDTKPLGFWQNIKYHIIWWKK